ncbi:hypothetical protein E4U19_001265 [Claviceps sp. Clav32 group G5]|nr:hypothetical protein E4U40_006856 [Claviceps sp. LM458 group G5]KAG6037966.1 hypothetical protein E4U19_001265 [Claviceps sp. Clav32 group G5]KAG6052342.1 hypothetical protein E4U39_000067 [Claviceps sp. Clav50 group G5]
MPTALQSKHNGGGVTDVVQDKASGAVSYAQGFVDWLMPPTTRRKAYNNISGFASRRPLLFSFLLTQVLWSFFPVFLFFAFSLGCIAVALGSAIVFSLFWMGVGLLVLTPTLFVTSSIAVMVWAWAVGTFVVARWLYLRTPISVNAGMQVDAAGKQINILKDEKGFDGNVKTKDTSTTAAAPEIRK